MDSSDDVYYTENTEIIDESVCWDMQEAVIIDSENLQWQEEGPEVTVSYSEDDNDQTLTENEVYLSTNADDSIDTDKSEYYSILETTYQPQEDYEENVTASIVVNVPDNNESILPDLPDESENEIDPGNYSVKKEISRDDTSEESLSNQVVLYHSDDPNEMFAIQIADDGSGNLQRYKYRVRQTADGQLEAIPGTIEVQDTSIEEGMMDRSGGPQEITSELNIPTAVMKTEIIDPDLEEDVNEDQDEDELEDSIRNTQGHFLDHSIQEQDVNDENFEGSETYLDEDYGTPEYLLSDDESGEQNYESESIEGIKIQNTFSLQHINPEVVYSEDDSNFNDFQEKTNSEMMDRGSTPITKKKFFKSKDSSINSIVQVSEPYKKNDLIEKEYTLYKNDKNISYMVFDRKEKENVQVAQMKPKTSFKNSRSVLKSNCIVPVEEVKQDMSLKKVSSVRMLNNNKGLVAKVKEVIIPARKQAEINEPQVKILAKSERQPRKQTIKPIERSGSEIIVQPMFYSLNTDYPQLIPKKRKYNYRNSHEVVKVSDDSDPDYTEKSRPKKKKISLSSRNWRNKKIAHITISDSEESAMDRNSVIEVPSDHEQEVHEEQDITEEHSNQIESIAENLPENKEKTVEDSDLDKSDDIMKIQEAVANIVQEREKNKIEKQSVETEKKNENESVKLTDKIINKRNNIKCPICPKTFARQVDLKKHTNVHSARRVLRSKTNITNKPDKNILPKKLVSNTTLVKKTESFICTVCKLKFFSETQLSRHKLIHKVNKGTTLKTATPKKQFLRNSKKMSATKTHQSTKLFKDTNKGTTSTTVTTRTQSKKTQIGPFKCEYCTKSFSQHVLLTAHRLVHKQFSCCNCAVKFPTKVLLDEHFRKNCVKFKSPMWKVQLKRSPVKNKQTIPKVISTISKINENTNKKICKSNTLNASTKKGATPSRNAHGGVPLSSKMQKAFDKMKLRS